MSEQKPDQRQSILSRLRQFLPGRGRGDTIVANVGDNARDVIVGKNILKIGTLEVPTLPVVITLLVVIGAATLGGWFFFVPDKMTGAFKIAVADFGEVDAQGQVRSSENGDQLSQWIFHALEDEFKNLPSDLRQTLDPQIWHDSLWPLKIRTRIGTVPDDPDVACQRAAAIGADILIYGNLKADQNVASFAPRFCIRQVRKDTDELDDIIGNHQLGAPISVRLPLKLPDDPVARLALNSRLVTRVDAMSRLTIGLLYDLIGDSNTALDVFQKTNSDLRWDDRDGKEILYYFIGKQYLYLKQLPQARAAFEKALSLNPDYARAHIGLGSTYYESAQDLASPVDRLQNPDLAHAMDEYQQALTLARRQQDRRVELQAHFALGTAYRLKGEAFLFQNQLDQADSFLDLTIQEINRGLELITPDQHRLLGHADLAMATAYHQKAHIRLTQGNRAESKTLFDQANDWYSQCIKQADASPEDQFLADKIKAAACVPYKKDVERALIDLQTAKP